MQHTCKRCGYTWESQKEKPVSCPACKSYKWNKDRKDKGGK